VEAAVFDHERLEVYKLQLEFIGWATKLLEEIEQHGKRRRPRSGSRGRRTTTRDENECNG
jgi:hypothetical protein